MKNKSQVINDSDKNSGAVIADKTDIITECKSQLYGIKTYIKLSMEEMEMLIAKIKLDVTKVVRRNKLNLLSGRKHPPTISLV